MLRQRRFLPPPSSSRRGQGRLCSASETPPPTSPPPSTIPAQRHFTPHTSLERPLLREPAHLLRVPTPQGPHFSEPVPPSDPTLPHRLPCLRASHSSGTYTSQSLNFSEHCTLPPSHPLLLRPSLASQNPSTPLPPFISRSPKPQTPAPLSLSASRWVTWAPGLPVPPPPTSNIP